jgi:hypothetical protein
MPAQVASSKLRLFEAAGSTDAVKFGTAVRASPTLLADAAVGCLLIPSTCVGAADEEGAPVGGNAATPKAAAAAPTVPANKDARDILWLDCADGPNGINVGNALSRTVLPESAVEGTPGADACGTPKGGNEDEDTPVFPVDKEGRLETAATGVSAGAGDIPKPQMSNRASE